MNSEIDKILQNNQKRVKEIEYFIRPTSHPISVRFFEKGEEKPENIKRLDYSVTICQATTLARVGRKNAKPFLITKENVCCSFARAVVGFTGWPEDIKKGERDVGIHFATEEGFKKAFDDLQVLPPESIDAIAMGSLWNFPLEPDIILFAVMPGQINRFTDGYVWHKGGCITIHFSGMCGVCSYGVVRTLKEKTAALSFPCFGGRRVGFYQDHELIAGVHVDFFDKWVDGLRKTEATGHSFPNTFALSINNPGLPHYKIIEWPDKIVPAKSTAVEK